MNFEESNNHQEPNHPEELISLSKEQVEMLMLSEQDIIGGNLISESELDEIDKRWLG